MMPQPENRGGLIGQLRDYALRGSDDGAWNENVEQESVFSRTTSLRSQRAESIRVDFEARRIPLNIGSHAMRTLYILRGTNTRVDLGIESMPENVLRTLRRKKVYAGDENASTVIAVGSGAGEEMDESEFDGYEDSLFRHIRGVQYEINGRGTLLRCAREDFYEDSEESGLDLLETRTAYVSSLVNDERATLALKEWGVQPVGRYPLELMSHPGLQKLEAKNSIRGLDDDVSFFNIVEQYVANKRLRDYTQVEHRRVVLTLLAFLRMDASAKDIQALL